MSFAARAARELRCEVEAREFYSIAPTPKATTRSELMSTVQASRYYDSMILDGDLAAIRDRLIVALAPPRKAYRPLLVEGRVAGWLDDARATRLAAFIDVFDVRDDGVSFVGGIDTASTRTAATDGVARALAAEGQLTAWRDERYPVAPEFGAPPWFVLERAAARFFGIHTFAAHVNGLVRGDDEVRMWFARRSATKAIDPAMLDNLVGGGIAAGRSVADTVIKEAWEEAGIGAALAALAQPAGAIHICREQSDGLQREAIFVHDLWLPAEFAPLGQDGEVVDHRLIALSDAARLIAIDEGPDVVTADASLVVLDFLLRHGAIAPDAPGYTTLEALRRAMGIGLGPEIAL
jgi:8-oxo-dGTP pyrophosphatase MutT (NUDIX family)